MSAMPGSGHKWLFPTSIVLGVRGGVEIGRFRVRGKRGPCEGRGGGGAGSTQGCVRPQETCGLGGCVWSQRCGSWFGQGSKGRAGVGGTHTGMRALRGRNTGRNKR
jgi:hypothetical protein